MNIDLSRNIYESYRKAVKRAIEFQNAGELKRAAAVYRQAAGLAREHAKYAVGSAERARRLARAEELGELAEQLAQGVAPAGQEPSRREKSGVDQQTPEQDDELGAQVLSLITKTNVRWEDIGGLDRVKRQIQMAFGLAVAKRPEAVEIDVVNNILLYGPPGTGKSLLAGALSNGLDAAFFNVGVSKVLSKWFGESPKLVSRLYEIARQRSPSIVFLDELESLFPSRESATTGPERRLLSALLAELSGVATEAHCAPVFTIGATNAPWLIDVAALSRFGRRVYVPLPDEDARRAVLEIHLKRKGYRLDFDVERLVEASEGLSCRQLAHTAARAVEAMLTDVNPDLPDVAVDGRTAIARYRIKTRLLQWRDFEPTLATMRPDTSSETVQKYVRW